MRRVDFSPSVCYRPARRRPHETAISALAAQISVAPRVSDTAPGRGVFVSTRGGLVLVQIVVRDNNVEQALRALKKKMQREGTFREMKRRKFYEKPSEKRARQKAEAVRRARKLIRKRMQREGAV